MLWSKCYKGVLASIALLATFAMADNLNAELVGRWEFNDEYDIGKATVGGGDLTDVNAVSYSKNGRFGGAVKLEQYYVDEDNNWPGMAYLHLSGDALPAGLPTGNSSYTVSTWVNIASSTSWELGVIGWGTNALRGYNGLKLPSSTSVQSVGWGEDTTQSTSSAINDGQWHLVTTTYDSTAAQKRLYFDGVLLGSAVSVGSFDVTAANFRIGEFYINGTIEQGFNGMIDDVRIYNNALSGTEVASLYSTVPEPGACVILLTGLLGLMAYAWRKRKHL